MVLKIIRKLKAGEDFKLPGFLHIGAFLSKLLDKFAFPSHRLDDENKKALEVFTGSFCSWNWSRSAKTFIKKYHGERQQTVTSKYNHVFFIPGAVIAIVTSLFLVLVLIFLGAVPLAVATVLGLLGKICCINLRLPIFEELNLW